MDMAENSRRTGQHSESFVRRRGELVPRTMERDTRETLIQDGGSS